MNKRWLPVLLVLLVVVIGCGPKYDQPTDPITAEEITAYSLELGGKDESGSSYEVVESHTRTEQGSNTTFKDVTIVMTSEEEEAWETTITFVKVREGWKYEKEKDNDAVIPRNWELIR